jgi:hypothetical protein
MKLASMNCEFFGVTLEIPENTFNKEAFFHAIPFSAKEASKIFERRGQFRSLCSRKTKQIDYMADVIVHRLDSKNVGIAIHVNLLPTTRGPAKREKPPFAEQIFEWFQQFISPDASIEIAEAANFIFPTKIYESVFSLPLKLSGTLNYTGNPVFENSQMVGVRILAGSNQAGITSMLQEIVPGKEIRVMLQRRADSTPSKLSSIESDVQILYNIGKSSVKQIRKLK